MTGRDPLEEHRASTPLELLFDLTFVVAFSQISSQTARFLEVDDLRTALISFVFSTFAVGWAWINYSWLASAYDNDDVFFRIATLVEMVGVLVMALGIPPFFHSVALGHVDLRVMVAGYVVMRVAAVALWIRAAINDPAHRATCIAYASDITIAQIGWVALLFADPSLGWAIGAGIALILVELAGPIVAELHFGRSPWHPHHIAERYGLLVIITLGEVILGTIVSVSAVVQSQGWSTEAVLVAAGGTTLAFGLWWVYFQVPSGPILARHPARAFAWGYLHQFLFASLVGIGAGLHVAAQVITHSAEVDATFALLCVAVPVLVFEVLLYVLYSLLVLELDPLHIGLFLGGVALLAVSVVAVSLGVSIGVALLIVAASPVVTIVGYETVGWRHEQAVLERNS